MRYRCRGAAAARYRTDKRQASETARVTDLQVKAQMRELELEVDRLKSIRA